MVVNASDFNLQEVKKSGTWRPQLDMYKKQNAELHQKLAEEAKNTDRQVFENKKLIEKMEALMQEKDVSNFHKIQNIIFYVVVKSSDLTNWIWQGSAFVNQI